MALLSVLFNDSVRAQIHGMQLDASINEGHTRTAKVSVSPIEDGTTISDHVTLEPVSLSIEGLISDVPLSVLNSVVGVGSSTLVSGATGLVGGPLGGIAGSAAAAGIGSVASLVTGNPRKASDGFKFLEELYSNRQPFTVITALKKYENMIITSLNIPRNSSVGRGLKFSVQLQQVTIVRSAIVRVPAFQLKGDAATRGQSAADIGKQGAKGAKAATLDKSKSILANFVDDPSKLTSIIPF